MTPGIKKNLANVLLEMCKINLFDDAGNVPMEHPLWDLIESQRLVEREACAHICDKESEFQSEQYSLNESIVLRNAAYLIRARGGK